MAQSEQAQAKAGQGGPWEKSQMANVLMSFFGITRATLRHYEATGLITPQRSDSTSYREYSLTDISRIIRYLLIRQVGGGVADARDTNASDAASLICSLQEKSREKLRYQQSLDAAFAHLGAIIKQADEQAEPMLARCESWRMYFDGCEQGAEGFRKGEVLDRLLDLLPISLFGSIIDDTEEDPAQSQKFGRVIRDRDAGLLAPKLDHGPSYRRFDAGTCACLAMAMPSEDLLHGQGGASAIEAIDDFLARRHLEKAGCLFSYGLSLGETFYANYLMPVRARDLRGHLELRGLSELS